MGCKVCLDWFYHGQRTSSKAPTAEVSEATYFLSLEWVMLDEHAFATWQYKIYWKKRLQCISRMLEYLSVKRKACWKCLSSGTGATATNALITIVLTPRLLMVGTAHIPNHAYDPSKKRDDTIAVDTIRIASIGHN